MIKRINAYDLDGLAIDSTHRYRSKNGSIDLDFWVGHNTRQFIMRDELMPMAQHIKDSIANPEIFVVIATARACEKNDANYEFLYGQIGRPNRFIHREGINDERGGADIKILGMRKFLGLKQFSKMPIHIYEDNASYLEKWTHAMRDKGHPTVGHYNPSYQGH